MFHIKYIISDIKQISISFNCIHHIVIKLTEQPTLVILDMYHAHVCRVMIMAAHLDSTTEFPNTEFPKSLIFSNL